MSVDREHALLSASGATRWLNCPPSARLEESLPESESVYAEEGTLAHSIAELKVLKDVIGSLKAKDYKAQHSKLTKSPLYSPEMEYCTDMYSDYISKQVHAFASKPYIATEKRVDYGHIAPEGFGTCDCAIVGGDMLIVVDYKHGKGVPVSAEENSQMKLYALGAYQQLAMLFPITRVKLVIVQPRRDCISEYELSIEALLAWGEDIKPTAQLAFEGKGEFNPGEHCRFCRAKALCRARSQAHTALEDFGVSRLPPILSNAEVGDILKRARTLAKWVSDLEEYALGECLKGNSIPGWKAVEGRSVRAFTDTDAAFEVLKQSGFDEALLYERKPLSLAGVEKLIGKHRFKELLSDKVITPPGKPALVEESDKREALTRTDAATDFAAKQ